jgi:DNA-binding CsgD family transcriptional regulator
MDEPGPLTASRPDRTGGRAENCAPSRDGGWAAPAVCCVPRAGERARRRSSETVDELTPQELHIARLVGSGATSKEVAAHLFLSPRTIDAHLRSIFRKLDITSRRQLRGMAVEESATAASV